jgi:membrane protease YdiL (CAAX protease family)
MFTLRLTLTLLIAAIAAALIAPLIAPLVAWAGFHFPFPRILDRVVMVTMAVAIWREHRELKLLARLRTAFAQPSSSLGAAGLGLIIGFAAIGVLWGLAWWIAAPLARANSSSFVLTFLGAIVPALIIAIIEESFFRAFLLDAIAEDYGRRTGLIASSAVYAAAHFVRSPARFQLNGIHPLAGLQTLVAGLRHLGHPMVAAPGLFGLFLLGLLLGITFVKSGRVYFAIGLHASLIVGAKTFRKFAPGAQTAPGWLSGYGFPPLISGPVAWLLTLALLVIASRLRWDAVFPVSAGVVEEAGDVKRESAKSRGSTAAPTLTGKS